MIPRILVALIVLTGVRAFAAPREPLFVTVDLDVGQTARVHVGGADGREVAVTLLALRETTDTIRHAVRRAEVEVDVDGARVTLVSAMYRLPVTVGGVVRIDCPVTAGLVTNSRSNVWSLDRAARLRLWPAGSPFLAPGTFRYPARQRWFASDTQMANDPTFVDGGEVPGSRSIYYHYGLDIGGAEGLVDVLAATDGVVVQRGDDILPDQKGTPAQPRYDVLYIVDERGWYYRYSHLQSFDASVKLGERVRMGQKIGTLGKEGGSGGWSHLHFDITSRQPSGKWGIQEGYAFLWEAYLREREPNVIAVARPHRIARSGERVAVDATRSWSSTGRIASFEWTFSDGTTSREPIVERVYEKSGVYSEILKVSDGAGHVAYDFAVVQILDAEHLDQLSPSIHAAWSPTTGIRPGREIAFKVRSFRIDKDDDGEETWDFGDGSPKVRVRSDGNAVKHAKDGYAVTRHAYEKPGDYIASVSRTNRRGQTATARVWVRVEESEEK